MGEWSQDVPPSGGWYWWRQGPGESLHPLFATRYSSGGEWWPVQIPEPDERRLQLQEGREHLTVTNEFKSDKYPWCPAGFVPLKITDPMARDLLLDYARRRREVDSEFSRALEDALRRGDGNG